MEIADCRYFELANAVAWSRFLPLLFLITVLLALVLPTWYMARKEIRNRERWLERALDKSAWKVVHGGQRLGRLGFHCRSVHRHMGRARPLAIYRTNRRTAWLFRMATLGTNRPLVGCVVQSVRFDFPRAAVENKGVLPLFPRPRSSAQVETLCPRLCEKWVVRNEDHTPQTLALLSSLQEVLSEVTTIIALETAGSHLVIVGQCVFDPAHLPRFVQAAHRVVQSFGESDLFAGADWTAR